MIEEAPGCTIDDDLKAFLDGRGLRIVEKATIERLCSDANDLRAALKAIANNDYPHLSPEDFARCALENYNARP